MPEPPSTSQFIPRWPTRLSPAALGETEPGIETAPNDQSQQDIISTLSTSTIIQSVAIFARKFPELAFIHLSSFSGSARSYEHVQRRVHIAAIISLCRSLLPQGISNLQSAEDYATYAREGLSRVVIDPPSITIVQTLLTIAMYEWGNGNGYRAWMYSGKDKTLRRFSQALTACRHGNPHDAINTRAKT